MTNQTAVSQTFHFQESHDVRIQVINGEPVFCLLDVASILSIQNAKISRFNLSEAGVHKMYLRSGGQKRELTFIDEPNLYRVIFRSNKKEAVEFQNWVFEEVLPTIRKTGEYRKPAQSLEKIDNNDMANLSRLVWLMSKGFNCESALSAGIWHSLRAVTQTASPEKFNVQDLPLLAEECKRIIAKVNQFKKVVYDAEKKMIKTVIRKSGDISEILAEIEQQTNQITETSTQALAMIERYEEVAINKLVSRVH